MSDHHDCALALRALLAALMRYALSEDIETGKANADAAREAQRVLRARGGVVLPADLDCDAQWVFAVDDAESDPDLVDHAGVSASMPKTMPFEKTLLLAEPFDPDAIRLRIRGAAATG